MCGSAGSRLQASRIRDRRMTALGVEQTRAHVQSEARVEDRVEIGVEASA